MSNQRISPVGRILIVVLIAVGVYGVSGIGALVWNKAAPCDEAPKKVLVKFFGQTRETITWKNADCSNVSASSP